MKMHQINDDDLCTLERTLPQLKDALFPQLADPQISPRLRVQLRRVKEILSNVRWSYGPPEKVEVISADDPA